MTARANVEFKARDPAPEETLRRALALGAADNGVLRQRDTFFATSRGRLKLREQTPGGAQLIQYERPDRAADKVSVYRLVDVPDPAALREALAAALGIRATVTKARRLLLLDHVRIHLDAVDGLGSFVEVEAVVPPGGRPEDEEARVAEIRHRLGATDLIDVAYADLLAVTPARAAGPG